MLYNGPESRRFTARALGDGGSEKPPRRKAFQGPVPRSVRKVERALATSLTRITPGRENHDVLRHIK